MSDEQVVQAEPTQSTPAETVPNAVETEVELTPEEQEAEAKALAEAQSKANKKKYQLKVNNKVKDLELDLSNDEEVSKYLQKAMAADEKFQEAASIRKQMESLIQELKSNPLAILKHPSLGLDVKKLAEMVMNEEIEEMSLTEEQKKLRDMEAKLKEYEEQKKQLEEEREAAQKAQLEEQAAIQLDESISQALATSSLPKSPYVVRRIADAMINAVQMGYSDVTPEQVMPFVEDQITNEINRLFEEAPEDTADKLMEKLVGKKSLDRYRKARISKSKKPPETIVAQVKDSGKKDENKQSKTESKETPVRFKDMFKTF